MKSEKGITLISLTVYIIGMLIVVSIVSIMSTFFYKNTNNIGERLDPIKEYTKFNSFFSDEVNRENIKILECFREGDEVNNNDELKNGNYIVFNNGIQYTFIDGQGIYRNKVKIAKSVARVENRPIFKENIKNGKVIIEVNFKIGDKVQSTTYTLKN